MVLHNLRSDDQLQILIRKEMKKMGLADKSDESSDTESSDSSLSSSASDSGDSSSDSRSSSKSQKKKKMKQPNISANASDRVKFSQKWPHAHLQY